VGRRPLPRHWHFVLWPINDGDLSDFTGWMTLTHIQRWHAHRGTTGWGHLNQGCFKSFPVQGDNHFHTVCRYVERNALRANLVERAEDWRCGSLYRWKFGTPKEKSLLSKRPLPRLPIWTEHVNQPLADGELKAIRRSILRGRPLGDSDWTKKIARRLGLETTLRARGRPKKQNKGSCTCPLLSSAAGSSDNRHGARRSKPAPCGADGLPGHDACLPQTVIPHLKESI